MKVILEIGLAKFLSDNAADAAKIADLLGNMKPVCNFYGCGTYGDIFYFGQSVYSHRVEITSIGRREIVASETVALELKAELEAKDIPPITP